MTLTTSWLARAASWLLKPSGVRLVGPSTAEATPSCRDGWTTPPARLKTTEKRWSTGLWASPRCPCKFGRCPLERIASDRLDLGHVARPAHRRYPRRAISSLAGGELPKTGVTPDVVNQIRSKLERRVEVQDRQRLEGSGPIPPTLWALVAEWGIKPLCGLIAAVYALSLTRYATDWTVDLVATVGAVLAGLCACRIRWWRRVSIGWTTYSVFYLVVIVAILVRDTFF